VEGSCCSVFCMDTCWSCSFVNKSDWEYFMTFCCIKFDSSAIWLREHNEIAHDKYFLSQYIFLFFFNFCLVTFGS
jgi:hypothetical protein